MEEITLIFIVMKSLVRILIVASMPVILISCDPCYFERGNCADLFYFRVVDKVTQQDLVFTSSPVFQKDSVFLTTNRVGYTGSMSFTDSTRFMSRLSIPVDTFFLRFGANDVDTLLMKYDYVKVKCCKMASGYGKIQGIKFNGVLAKKAGDTFIFEK
jgi:hypothetical protein